MSTDTMSARNVEIKAKLNDVDKVVLLCKELTSIPEVEINQEDYFFRVPEGRLKLRNFSNGSAELIYYERPDIAGPKLCKYNKCDVNNANSLQQVLEAALGVKGVVRKVRTLFLVGQTRVHIDCVEGLGNFLELEVVLKDHQSLEDGQNIAYELMEKLGINKEDLLLPAYIDLITRDPKIDHK